MSQQRHAGYGLATTWRLRAGILLFAPALWFVTEAVAQDSFIVMVPMRDGVHLRTRVLLPPGDGPFPTMLGRTYQPDGDLYWHGLVTSNLEGYAFVNQSARGLDGSEGVDDALYQDDGWGEHQDGYDTVQWILAQPWCNGVVGSFGGSGRATFTNLLGGTTAPLAAEYVICGPADLYKGVLFEGGAWRRNETTAWYAATGEGTLATVLQHPNYDDFWRGMDVATRQHVRDHPIMLVGAWYDTYMKSTMNNYLSLQANGTPYAKAHSKFVVVLRAHGNVADDFGMPWPLGKCWHPPQPYQLGNFLDHYVKGVNNGYENLPNVAYFMMGEWENPDAPGNEWRYCDIWPPPGQTLQWFLQPGGVLSTAPPPPGAHAVTYAYDPLDPVPTVGGAVHYIHPGSRDQRSIEGRGDVILFETPVLTVPLEIAGAVTAQLWAASDAVDTDFTAKLTDVYPDGKSIILVDGIRRAAFRDSLENPSLMTPGTVYRFDIDLGHTAFVFDRGHRIRLAVSSSNSPKYDANPNTGQPPAEIYTQTQVANNTLHFSEAYPSHIAVNIVGPDSDGDGAYDYLDAFPDNATETQDIDGDGLGDHFEQRIIDALPDDGMATLADVRPQDDFDGDGASNFEEFMSGTDPTTSTTLPLAHHLLLMLCLVLAAHGLLRRKAR